MVEKKTTKIKKGAFTIEIGPTLIKTPTTIGKHVIPIKSRKKKIITKDIFA